MNAMKLSLLSATAVAVSSNDLEKGIPMKIILSDAGKRYNREWIFRHFDYQFNSSEAYAITGPNGSGKSTLLQFIAGAIMPTEGKIAYFDLNVVPQTDHCINLSFPPPPLPT